MAMMADNPIEADVRHVEVFDEQRNEWRYFEVPLLLGRGASPLSKPDVKFMAVCGNGLHQLGPHMAKCACGKVERQ